MTDYIEIPNWAGEDDARAGFQHYKHRDPKWIKNYTRLLAKDEYLALTLRQRGLLHGIWLAYASAGRKLGSSPVQLRRALGSETVRARDIEALNHAGFIHICASEPLAEVEQPASPETEERREQDQEPLEVTGESNVVHIHPGDTLGGEVFRKILRAREVG